MGCMFSLNSYCSRDAKSGDNGNYGGEKKKKICKQKKVKVCRIEYNCGGISLFWYILIPKYEEKKSDLTPPDAWN